MRPAETGATPRGVRVWLLRKLSAQAFEANSAAAKNEGQSTIPHQSAFSALSADVRDIVCMARDSLRGDYQAPWRALLIAGAASLYFLNPVDLIPDFIPVLGAVDDIAVLALTLKFIKKDLNKYREWRLQRTLT